MSDDRCVELNAAELQACRAIDRAMAEARRCELRAAYDSARILRDLLAARGAAERRALVALGRMLRKDRTTLLRYVYVARRIDPAQFERLVALSDCRGYPLKLWELVALARLPAIARLDACLRRLRDRPC